MTQPHYIQVRVTTEARREYVECKRGKYYIHIREKPKQGIANIRIKEILAKIYNCNTNQLRLVKGSTTPSKTFLLAT